MNYTILKKIAFWIGSSLGLLVIVCVVIMHMHRYGNKPDVVVTVQEPLIIEKRSEVETRYENGLTRERYMVVEDTNGKLLLDGVYNSFYPNGKAATSGAYKRFRPPFNLTKLTEWSADPLCSAGKEGDWTTWYQNGNKMSGCKYLDGQLDCTLERWHDNGKMSNMCYYSHGKKCNLEISFDTNLKPVQYIWRGEPTNWKPLNWLEDCESFFETYKHSLSIDIHNVKDRNVTIPFVVLDPTENKCQEGFIRNGKRVGRYAEWYENGVQSIAAVYRKGLLNGLETQWRKDGSKSSETRYRNDKKHGTAIEWYPDGQKRSITRYKDDYEIDTTYVWHSNGRLHTKKVYYSTCLMESIEWDEEGRVVYHKSIPEQYFMSPHLFNKTAKFITETSGSYRPREGIESWFWRINGQFLTWGSDTVQVPYTLSGMHVIEFYTEKGKPTSTTYCHISEPNIFTIYWNPCCDEFNIGSVYRNCERNDRSGEAVKLLVKGTLACEPLCVEVNTPMATVESIGNVLSNDSVIVPYPSDNARSAMSSNRQTVFVKVYYKGKCAKRKELEFSFMYVVLDTVPVSIIYDTETNKMYFKE
jgi:antitoxin component YwqK of YwqJK toxin-antitoxin module